MKTRQRYLLILLPLLMAAGCATPRQREAEAEARGYERGYRQAVKEQYWIMQNQQRAPAMPDAPNLTRR